jgi:ethanolamine transporter
MEAFATFITWLFTILFVVGGIDHIFWDKLKLGTEFTKGFDFMGIATITMLGMCVLANYLANFCQAALGPVFHIFGADPAMGPSIFIAIDTGGYALCHAMTTNADIADLSSCILGTTMAVILCSNIPLSLNIINKEDRKYMNVGSMAGIALVPFGTLIAGVMAGVGFFTTLVNLIPIFIVAVIIIFCLAKFPNGTMKVFNIFGWCVMTFILVGLILEGIKEELGFTLLADMADVSWFGPWLVSCTVLLAGAFVLMSLITKFLHKPLLALGSKIGVDDVCVSGMIISCVNSMVMFGMVKDMTNERSKIAAFAFNSGVAYLTGYLPTVLMFSSRWTAPVTVAKLFIGVVGIPLSFWLWKIMGKKLKEKSPAAAIPEGQKG